MRQPSSLLYGPRLAQQYGRSKDCQRSCSVLHDGALHAPFPSNTRCPPTLSISTFSSLGAMALGQVHLQGVWIEMHWSFTHWKQAYSLFPFFSLSSSPWVQALFRVHGFPSAQLEAWICITFHKCFFKLIRWKLVLNGSFLSAVVLLPAQCFCFYRQ